LSLNVVSSWWADEARQYGVHFEQHEDRYARTTEWLEVVDGLWNQDRFSYAGNYYRVEGTILQPKPLTQPRPCLYAGGESEAAKNVIAQRCDAYVMHGDPPERIAAKIADMRERRERLGLPSMQYGMAAYTAVRDTEREAKMELARITDVRASAAGYANYQQWLSGTQLEQRMTIEEYSVSNRGLRPGLIGTAAQVSERIEEFAAAGVDLLLLQCSPQAEEMERFSAEVIRPVAPALVSA
jgi:FMNH2-dependent dimethyl sulfone monooxygenase